MTQMVSAERAAALRNKCLSLAKTCRSGSGPASERTSQSRQLKLGPGGGSRVQEMSRTAFVGDQLMHGGQKGFGMTKHGRSGHATRSPRFRFLQKLEAQKNDRKDRSRITDPKQSVEELFHPRKPT